MEATSPMSGESTEGASFLDGLPAWVRSVPEVRDGEWAARSWRPVAEWRHGSKRFVAGDLLCTDASGETLVFHLLIDPGGRRAPVWQIYEGLKALWGSGMRAPSPYRVPRPFACDTAANVLVREFLAGRTWADSVLRTGAVDSGISERVAGWLIALQRIKAPGLLTAKPYPYRIIERATELADTLDYRPVADRIVGIAESVSKSIDRYAGQLVVSHGDFHPKNVLLCGTDVVAFDTDRLGLREPAADPGRALGQLMSMSLARLGATDAGARAGRWFQDAYDSSEGPAPRGRVALHFVATLFECVHYRVVIGTGAWPGTPRAWADSLERILDEGSSDDGS
ncbi:phosphotransferase family protein [Streptomyces sp. NPDC059398]|uniref:phosphotransferase family protein n=1 Tax=Streptomyces sp. NPDC059398 TaxID=3346820 RepID=UPI00369CB807